MELVVKNARLPGGDDAVTDIVISGGKIAAIEPRADSGRPAIDAEGRLVSPGFVETHIHLDKACILAARPVSRSASTW